MKTFAGRTAVITGAASGFGLEFALQAASRGMNLVLADVQATVLQAAAERLQAQGAVVLTRVVDVSREAEVHALAEATVERFGVPHLVFNNAGVAVGGLVWENTAKDWAWVLGVNLMGVIHGVRAFTPLMLQAARADAGFEGRIVNTASMAGLVNAPNMGVYNVSKHGVVALTESLYQDLALVSDQVSASVICPYFVPTGIHESHVHRPSDLQEATAPTQAQLIAKVSMDKAVTSGKVSAAQVAQATFEALAAGQFYIYSHPHALSPVQSRMEDVLQARNPTDPFLSRPEVGQRLRAALRGD